MERKKHKIRRNRVIIFLSLLLFSATLYASPSQSDFIPLSSDFYNAFDTLLTATGKVVNMTRPYTYGEARMYVEAIDAESMNETERELYDYLIQYTSTTTNENVFNFDFSLSLQPEMYFHYNTDFRDPIERTEENTLIYSYQNQDKYMLWNRDADHFLDMDLSLSVKDRVSLLFRLPVANTVHTGIPSGSRIWMTNIPFLSSPFNATTDSFQDFSMNFPYRAYISIADSWYSFQFGRERYNYGSGVTGNFIVNKTLPYHNALSLSFFSDTFKYTFLVSFFPHPNQYILLGDESQSSNMYLTDLIFDQNTDAFTGIKMFMSHRFDWTMENGRHRVAITEGIMYQNDKGILDLQVLNPMMLFHNMYIAGNSNSILQAEWDLAITKGVKQHMALAIDDFNIPFEDKDGSERRPNAIAIQYGISTSHAIGEGFLETAAEIVYMSPYFYLRDGKLASDYPLDFVITIRNQRSGEGVYDLYTIGYPNGGDQAILYSGISYKVPFNYGCGFSVEYRLFGKNNLMTIYNSKVDDNASSSHMITLKADWNYFLTRSLEIKGSITGKMIVNFNNTYNSFMHDVLFTIGLSYII